MTYSTKSLSIASFLYANEDIEFKGVDKSDPNNILFHFAPKDLAQAMVDSYYTETAFNVNAKKHDEAQKNLKDLIFEIKRQGQ